MRRTLAVPFAALALAGCGDSAAPTALRSLTPPSTATDVGVRAADDAVLAGWADALRAGDPEAAARFFALPALVANGPPLVLRGRPEVVAFNAALPCGARLVSTERRGRYLVGTFELTERPDNRCDGTGNEARVAFLMKKGRIAEWRRVPSGLDGGGPAQSA